MNAAERRAVERMRAALAPLLRAHDAYTSVHRNGVLRGETLTEQRFCLGEIADAAAEAAQDVLLDVKFEELVEAFEAASSEALQPEPYSPPHGSNCGCWECLEVDWENGPWPDQ